MRSRYQRGVIWGVMAAMTSAYTAALAAAALAAAIILPRLPAPAAAPTKPAMMLLAGAQPFDWDRYHARQDACSEKDRIVEACARGWCDELALRQAQRDCSAFGPLGSPPKKG